jgi:hypothetical protein
LTASTPPPIHWFLFLEAFVRARGAEDELVTLVTVPLGTPLGPRENMNVLRALWLFAFRVQTWLLKHKRNVSVRHQVVDMIDTLPTRAAKQKRSVFVFSIKHAEWIIIRDTLAFGTQVCHFYVFNLRVC